MFLAAFLPALIGALAGAMASLIGRAVIALGIGFVTYKGITVAIDAMKSAAINALTGMPADMIGLIGYLWIDKGITIIFSACAISLSMRVIGGSVKKMAFK